MSSPTLNKRVRHGDDDLALEAVGQPGDRLRRAVPRGGDDDQVGLAGGLVGGAVKLERAARPLLAQLGRHLLAALGRARADRYRHSN